MMKKEVIFYGIGALALLAVGYYLTQKAGSVVDAVNPANPDNVVNKTFTDAYQSITGSSDTLGGSIYDWIHGDAGKIATTPTGGFKVAKPAVPSVEDIPLLM